MTTTVTVTLLFPLVAVLLGFAPALIDAGSSEHNPKFEAHLYDGAFQVKSPPQTVKDWLCDIDHIFTKTSIKIVLHGMIGAGKSHLAARLVGRRTDQLAGVSDNGGVTTQATTFSGLSSDDRTKHLYVIDTPGFGERVVSQPAPGQSKYERQRMVLLEMEKAAALAMQNIYRIPFVRIYFLIDCDRSRDSLPASLKGNLRALLRVYGTAQLGFKLVFVVSKCDKLADKQFTRAQCEKIRNELGALFESVLQIRLTRPQDRVLFISPILTRHDRTTKGSLHNLAQDLVQAVSKSDSVEMALKCMEDGRQPPGLDQHEPWVRTMKQAQEDPSSLWAQFDAFDIRCNLLQTKLDGDHPPPIAHYSFDFVDPSDTQLPYSSYDVNNRLAKTSWIMLLSDLEQRLAKARRRYDDLMVRLQHELQSCAAANSVAPSIFSFLPLLGPLIPVQTLTQGNEFKAQIDDLQYQWSILEEFANDQQRQIYNMAS